MSREITHFEEKEEAKINRASETCQHTNTHTKVVPEKKTRKRSREKIFEVAVNENIPNLN